MAAWSSRKLLKEVLLRRVSSNPPLPRFRCFSTSAPESAPKISHHSKKGRLLTGATIGIVIAGGAYVSTVDEATFWYFIWEFDCLDGYSQQQNL